MLRKTGLLSLQACFGERFAATCSMFILHPISGGQKILPCVFTALKVQPIQKMKEKRVHKTVEPNRLEDDGFRLIMIKKQKATVPRKTHLSATGHYCLTAWGWHSTSMPLWKTWA
ncbi:hypothetical protein KC335_g162 [Hortaea werneckii]|nr:hypothetical protein KC335_g162 [Hortaea werneckii]